MGTQNILFDGTVFAIAETNAAARTGVFFLLRDLALALESTRDVHLSLTTAPDFMPLLDQALSGTALQSTLDPGRRLRVGLEPWAFLSTFHPVHPQLHTIPQLSVFQIVYDLSFHACPDLVKPGGLEFEQAVMGSIAQAGHAICISENTRNDAIKFFNFPPERASVVYPAVRSDLERAPEGAGRGQAPAWVGLPPGAQYVLALSTLEPRKNLATSLKAFLTACEAAPEAPLYFVVGGVDGWGDQMRLFEEAPDHLKERIRLLGYVTDPLLPGLLEGALCLLYPSLYEGFGLPPLEAMSRGVPIIVSNAGSLPEVTGDAGVVADVFDHQTMGEAIARWARDPAKRDAIGAKGRAQAARFSWYESANRLVEVMQANPKAA